MKKIDNTLEDIKKWCSDNRIGIFKGTFEKGSPTRVIWSNDDDDEKDYLNFLLSIKNSSAKSIVIECEKNDLDLSEYEFSDYINESNRDIEEFLRDSWKLVQKNSGSILSVKLTYIDNLASFIYELKADWQTDYHTIIDLVDTEEDPDIETDDDDNSNIINIDNDTIERIAKIITADEQYLNSKNLIEKRAVADRISTDNAIGQNQWYNQKLISDRALSIYFKDIKPVQDENLKKKIIELKEKGLPKVKISGQLGVSMTELNKLLYSEK